MKLKKKQKIIIAVLMLVFVIFIFNDKALLAAINTEYSATDVVTNAGLDSAVTDSSIFKQLAQLIYAIGRFLEWILGVIFKLLTGSTDFPWADKIVFNAVPLLDVNFMNPAENSFVIQDGIQGVLKNLYSTILGIAIGFFGITVLITAIKLVISTIASEKAKYKQAIIDWLVGFVLLFCIHYFISFIFYLNEELVKVASNIVSTQLEDAKYKTATIQTSKYANELIEDIRNEGTMYGEKEVAGILDANPMILETWMNLASEDASKGIQEALMKNVKWYFFGVDVSRNDKAQYKNLGLIVSWAAAENIPVKDLVAIKSRIKVFNGWTLTGKDNDRYKETYNQALRKKDFELIFRDETMRAEILKEFQLNEDAIRTAEQSSTDSLVVNYSENGEEYYLSRGASKFGSDYNSGYTEETTAGDSWYWTEVLNDLITLKSSSDTSSGNKVEGSGSSKRLIADLAAYFRYNAYNKVRRTTNVTGLTNGKNMQVQNMIMYAILVAQSLILFIAYIKRLFYVIILAMMAPVVVVFDFFQRFGK